MHGMVNLVQKEVSRWTFSQKASIVLIVATLVSFPIRLPRLFVIMFAVSACVATLAVALVVVIRSKGVAGYMLFLCLFLLAFALVQIRSLPTPIPLERAVTARMRLVSYPRVSRRNIQFRARVLDIEGKRVSGRVLFSMPFTSENIERGDLVEAQGMFFALPFERSEGYARYLQSSGIEAVFEGFSGRVTVLGGSP